jgi:hypothetical protein
MYSLVSVTRHTVHVYNWGLSATNHIKSWPAHRPFNVPWSNKAWLFKDAKMFLALFTEELTNSCRRDNYMYDWVFSARNHISWSTHWPFPEEMCLDQTRHGLKDKGYFHLRGRQNVFGTAEWSELTMKLCCVSDKTTMTRVSLLETTSLGLHIDHSLKKCALLIK